MFYLFMTIDVNKMFCAHLFFEFYGSDFQKIAVVLVRQMNLELPPFIVFSSKIVDSVLLDSTVHFSLRPPFLRNSKCFKHSQPREQNAQIRPARKTVVQY